MWRRGLPLVAAAVVLAACGSGDPAQPADDAPRAPDRAERTPSPSATASGAQAPARRGIRLAAVGRFHAPLYVTAPPGDTRTIFVVEQGGRIMVVRGERKLARPFLNISGQVLAGGEQGLLSMAFAPDYARSRRFYVYFTGRDGRENVVEDRAASASCCACPIPSPTTTAACCSSAPTG